MNISDQYKTKETKSLHEQRWEESKRKHLDKVIGFSEESTNTKNMDSSGKDLTIKPLIYYNLTDCLNNVMQQSDFKEKATKNIAIIKSSRNQKGQRLAEHKDIKDIEGEFGKTSTSSTIGAGLYAVKYHNFVKEWLGTVCHFVIKEQNVGFGQTKRKGYTIDKVYVFYYGKNGIHIGRELVLKIAFWMWAKPEERK